MRRNADLQEFNFALEFADYLSYLDANITKQNKRKTKTVLKRLSQVCSGSFKNLSVSCFKALMLLIVSY
jgi:hypothetical protein